MINDKCKREIIFKIDECFPLLQRTVFSPDLKSMRSKYVYKDISKADWEKDLLFLKSIEEILKNN